MTMEELVIAIRVTADNAEASLEAIADGLRDIGKTADSSLQKVERQMKSVTRQLQNTTALKRQVSGYKDLAKQVKDTGGGWDDLTEEVQAFGRRLGVAEGDLDGVISGLEGMETQSAASAAGMVAQLTGILGTLNALSAQLVSIPPAELTADASQAMAEIDALIAMINLVLSLAGQAGISIGGVRGGGGGGGGGGGRRSAAFEAEAAARAAEQAARDAEREQEEAYRAELERIEHRRHMGEITARQEIAELERVKREYAKTAEQIMDIDEQIYDARQELRENEADKITTLYDSIVEALEARYEEQREIEQKRIADSIEAWEKWSDDTCAAIQKQIDALDEQAEAEDRAATEAENLRKIKSLEEALLYETDAYNQSQLRRQIEQAQEAWAKVQRGWAQEDERAALEKQMQAIAERADAEIDALEKESERIDSVYDEMVKGQSLAAEAQKLLMQSTQEDLLSLLSSYAPDYEATGRSLGEKIYKGFQSAFGDITAWFDRVDAQFEQMAESAKTAAFGTTTQLKQSGQAAANAAGPTINQTVNFNQPVESPADVTRRMQQVSEELAGMM